MSNATTCNKRDVCQLHHLFHAIVVRSCKHTILSNICAENCHNANLLRLIQYFLNIPIYGALPSPDHRFSIEHVQTKNNIVVRGKIRKKEGIFKGLRSNYNAIDACRGIVSDILFTPYATPYLHIARHFLANLQDNLCVNTIACSCAIKIYDVEIPGTPLHKFFDLVNWIFTVDSDFRKIAFD